MDLHLEVTTGTAVARWFMLVRRLGIVPMLVRVYLMFMDAARARASSSSLHAGLNRRRKRRGGLRSFRGFRSFCNGSRGFRVFGLDTRDYVAILVIL